MRPEKNKLDLNNLPEDSSSGASYRRKKNSPKDGKDECDKVYECRFCSFKFCKSQALGGHMNRHRQERETETLNRARELVFTNDNISIQSVKPEFYHPVSNIVDPTLPFRSFNTSRIIPSSQPPQTYSYTYPFQYPDCHVRYVFANNYSSTLVGHGFRAGGVNIDGSLQNQNEAGLIGNRRGKELDNPRINRSQDGL